MAKAANFGDLPEEYSNLDNAAIVIVPVPYDETSTWGRGADRGPAAMLDASANMELYDIETNTEVYRHGIFTDVPVEEKSSPEKMVNAVAARIDNYVKQGKFAVVIGGEHSVSIGAVKAHAQNYPRLTVLQLDAHSDLRDKYNGSRYNHACVSARVKEMCPIVHVGIRSMASSEKPFIDKDNVFFARDIFSDVNWINRVLARVTDNVYITIDLDVFDPSIMSSTGTPEPGGLLWYDVLALLKAVTERKNLVGFDVVELCPNKNNTSADFLVAKLIYKLLSYKFRDSK